MPDICSSHLKSATMVMYFWDLRGNHKQLILLAGNAPTTSNLFGGMLCQCRQTWKTQACPPHGAPDSGNGASRPVKPRTLWHWGPPDLSVTSKGDAPGCDGQEEFSSL